MMNKTFNTAHYLMGVRLDNWLRLLWRSRLELEPKRLPQTLYISAMSLLLSPFALLEALTLALPLTLHKPEKDPVFILGFWRSGTTYLQDVLSQDPQFGWADPVSTATFSNSVLLRPLMRLGVKGPIQDARPMDNVRYNVDSPMEETFAVANISPWCLDHLISFPNVWKSWLSSVFVEDMTPAQRRDFDRKYRYVLKKMSLLKGGRQLLLKSPDNTGRVRELLKLYPDAKFLNIYRDPYASIRSTINMFLLQVDMLRLTKLPDVDLEDTIEDVVIGLYERMYRELFEMEGSFKPGHFVSIHYEQFTADPENTLQTIYQQLGLDGFETALPRFRAYIDSQKGYQKNRFDFSPRLRKKINERLGFCFQHYGYPMIEEVAV